MHTEQLATILLSALCSGCTPTPPQPKCDMLRKNSRKLGIHTNPEHGAIRR